jgi:hypothetical protein
MEMAAVGGQLLRCKHAGGGKEMNLAINII